MRDGGASAARGLTAVVPTRGSDTLAGALGSLATALLELGQGTEIVVVDDAASPPVSPPASFQGIPVRVLRSSTRRGFGPAVNLGVRASTSRWVAIVNDDVELERDCLALLCAALEDGKAWVACPAIAAREGASSSAHGAWLIDESLYRLTWDRATLRTIPIPLGRTLEPHYPSGALAVYDRACWEELGGYDERLAPYYWEDVDLGLRARARVAAGDVRFHALHVPAAAARHARHATVAREARWLRKTIYRRNRELVIARHLADSARRRWHVAALLARAARGLLAGDASHLLGACWAWRLGLAGRRGSPPPTATLDAIFTSRGGVVPGSSERRS
ncbi:MAG: glycosyltransferase [bacterium]